MHRTLSSLLPILALSSLCGCYVPNSNDRAKADAVANYISSKYGQFEQRNNVEKTRSGKILYTRPGLYPEVRFYEIHDPKDISEIEASAKDALVSVGIDRVRLVFLEKQNLVCDQSGKCARGKENIIKEILVAN
jgi:predicted small lipoprotein YifL